MPEFVHSPEDLRKIYQSRFAGNSAYRKELWKVLSSFFTRWIPADATLLDLGCGYCEFVNTIQCQQKLAMDLNPDARLLVDPSVSFIEQDCSMPWQITPGSLDVVFTSNFFEHLPDKASLQRTLREAHTALRNGGQLIAMGPNINQLHGAYWDFFDHYLPLTELSLAEALEKSGFEVISSWRRFLPYTMSHRKRYPIWMVHLYLSLPSLWHLFGKQFLIIARKKPE
jgi:SAM-dependent methyltransferase